MSYACGRASDAGVTSPQHGGAPLVQFHPPTHAHAHVHLLNGKSGWSLAAVTHELILNDADGGDGPDGDSWG